MICMNSNKNKWQSQLLISLIKQAYLAVKNTNLTIGIALMDPYLLRHGLRLTTYYVEYKFV